MARNEWKTDLCILEAAHADLGTLVKRNNFALKGEHPDNIRTQRDKSPLPQTQQTQTVIIHVVLLTVEQDDAAASTQRVGERAEEV
jgi:hypothetical protein